MNFNPCRFDYVDRQWGVSFFSSSTCLEGVSGEVKHRKMGAPSFLGSVSTACCPMGLGCWRTSALGKGPNGSSESLRMDQHHAFGGQVFFNYWTPEYGKTIQSARICYLLPGVPCDSPILSEFAWVKSPPEVADERCSWFVSSLAALPATFWIDPLCREPGDPSVGPIWRICLRGARVQVSLGWCWDLTSWFL